MARRTRCSDHCSACGLHFTSTNAFDAHRVGSYSDGGRHCEHPLDLRDADGQMVLIELTEVGRCEMYPPNVEHPVTLWGLRRDVLAARSMRTSLGTVQRPRSGEDPGSDENYLGVAA